MTASIPAATAYSASESPAFPCVGHSQPGETERPGHRHRHRHPPVLERQRRIAPETRVVLPLVLDLEPAAELLGQRMGVGQARRVPFAARHDVAAVVGVGDVQRQQPPNRQRSRREGSHQPSRPTFRLEPLEIQNHLDRAVVALAQVHHLSGRILGTAHRTGQVGDITHLAITPLAKRSSSGCAIQALRRAPARRTNRGRSRPRRSADWFPAAARAREVRRAVDDGDSPGLHRGQAAPLAVRTKSIELGRRAIEVEAARRDDDHIRTARRHFVPGRPPRLHPGMAEDLDAAGPFDDLGVPVPGRVGRIEPLEQENAGPSIRAGGAMRAVWRRLISAAVSSNCLTSRSAG